MTDRLTPRTLDELLADYLILDAFDRHRSTDHDMGHGRRRRQIDTLIDELVYAGVNRNLAATELETVEFDGDVTAEAIAAAWKRIGVRALARKDLTRSAVYTWRLVGEIVARRLMDAPSDAEVEAAAYEDDVVTPEEAAEARRIRRELERRGIAEKLDPIAPSLLEGRR